MIRSAPLFHVATRPLAIEHEDGVVADAFYQQAKALFAAAQLLFMGSPPRQVARDLGEAQQLPVCISQRRDDDVGPELRAVFPDAPALVFERAGVCRDLEFVVGQVRGQGFRRIEPREVLADDLVGSVSLEALGARVPGENVPCGSSMKMA